MTILVYFAIRRGWVMRISNRVLAGNVGSSARSRSRRDTGRHPPWRKGHPFRRHDAAIRTPHGTVTVTRCSSAPFDV
jgi:hypothetical protein